MIIETEHVENEVSFHQRHAIREPCENKAQGSGYRQTPYKRLVAPTLPFPLPSSLARTGRPELVAPLEANLSHHHPVTPLRALTAFDEASCSSFSTAS